MKESSNRILSVIAVLCSLVTLGLFATLKPPESDVGEYVDRIEELEREIANLRGIEYQGPESEDEANEPEVPYAYLEFPDDGLDDPVQVQRDVSEMRWIMTVRGLMPPTEEHIARSEKTIFKSGQDVKQKLEALRILKRSNKISDDVVREMIHVFNGNENRRVQEHILNELDDLTTPELAPTLLEVSAKSPHSRVRRQAIDSMSGFLPDPDLEDWLRYVEDNDKDKRVRQEANRLLNKFTQRNNN